MNKLFILFFIFLTMHAFSLPAHAESRWEEVQKKFEEIDLKTTDGFDVLMAMEKSLKQLVPPNSPEEEQYFHDMLHLWFLSRIHSDTRDGEYCSERAEGLKELLEDMISFKIKDSFINVTKYCHSSLENDSDEMLKEYKKTKNINKLTTFYLAYIVQAKSLRALFDAQTTEKRDPLRPFKEKSYDIFKEIRKGLDGPSYIDIYP